MNSHSTPHPPSLKSMPSSQKLSLSFTISISCPICLQKCKAPVACNNGHVFCGLCLGAWKRSFGSEAVTCPSCREKSGFVELKGGVVEEQTEVDFTHANTIKDLEHSRKLRRTKFEGLLESYEEENRFLEKANSTLSVQLTETKQKIADLERDLAAEKAKARYSTPRKPVMDDRFSVLEPVKRRAEISGEPPSKRTRLDLTDEERGNVVDLMISDAMKHAEGTEKDKIISDLRQHLSTLQRENAKLKQHASPPTPKSSTLTSPSSSHRTLGSPSKWPAHESAVLKARIAQLEKELETTQKALDVADGYAEKLEGRIKELEGKWRTQEKTEGK